MIFRAAADAVVAIHFAFVLFVAFGALLALKWRRILWIQIPAAIWGVAVELSGGICPLTPLETHLRYRGGEAGYSGGFLEHHLIPVLYPAGLTRPIQFLLAAVVVVLNGLIYWYVIRRRGPAFASRSSGHGDG